MESVQAGKQYLVLSGTEPGAHFHRMWSRL